MIRYLSYQNSLFKLRVIATIILFVLIPFKKVTQRFGGIDFLSVILMILFSFFGSLNAHKLLVGVLIVTVYFHITLLLTFATDNQSKPLRIVIEMMNILAYSFAIWIAYRSFQLNKFQRNMLVVPTTFIFTMQGWQPVWNNPNIPPNLQNGVQVVPNLQNLPNNNINNFVI